MYLSLISLNVIYLASKLFSTNEQEHKNTNEIAKNNDNNFFIIILKINTRINKRSASAERLKIYV